MTVPFCLIDYLSFTDVCRELLFMNHTPGKALDGHVIKTLQVKNQEQCELGCFHESECVSYNTEPSQVNGFTCELSNSDHVRHPDALVPRPAYIYRGTEVKKIPNLVLRVFSFSNMAAGGKLAILVNEKTQW